MRALPADDRKYGAARNADRFALIWAYFYISPNHLAIFCRISRSAVSRLLWWSAGAGIADDPKGPLFRTISNPRKD
jgi:hypothetical protein